MMRRAFTFFVMALVLCSCATMQTIHTDPRAELLAAQKTFAATVDQLTAMREQGMFTVAEADKITLVISEADKLLGEWETAVLAGQPGTASKVRFDVLAQQLATFGGS